MHFHYFLSLAPHAQVRLTGFMVNQVGEAINLTAQDFPNVEAALKEAKSHEDKGNTVEITDLEAEHQSLHRRCVERFGQDFITARIAATQAIHQIACEVDLGVLAPILLSRITAAVLASQTRTHRFVVSRNDAVQCVLVPTATEDQASAYCNSQMGEGTPSIRKGFWHSRRVPVVDPRVLEQSKGPSHAPDQTKTPTAQADQDRGHEASADTPAHE